MNAGTSHLALERRISRIESVVAPKVGIAERLRLAREHIRARGELSPAQQAAERVKRVDERIDRLLQRDSWNEFQDWMWGKTPHFGKSAAHVMRREACWLVLALRGEFDARADCARRFLADIESADQHYSPRHYPLTDAVVSAAIDYQAKQYPHLA